MKVILIDPLMQSAHACPSLGLMYIAATLEREGNPVKIVEMRFLENPWIHLKKIILKEKPDVVGITTMSYTFPASLKIARITKNAVPNSLIVLGGPHATFMWAEILMINPEVDIVVIGEGEYTMLELIKTLTEGGSLKRIRGIAFREKKKVIKTPPRPLIKNLTSLPFPARHLVNMDKYRTLESFTPLISSRGCPFRCVFCASRAMWGAHVRFRYPKDVVDEIEHIIQKYRFKTVNFADDVFTLNKPRVIKICEEINERVLDVEWECSTRPDLLTKELMKKMRKAGCKSILLGAESASQRILNILNKGFELKDIEKVVKWAKEIGINVRLSFMIGCPGEDIKSAFKTLRFAKYLKEIGAKTACFSLFKVYPGALINKKLKEYGITWVDKDWEKYGSPLLPTCETKKLTKDDLHLLAIFAGGMEGYLNSLHSYTQQAWI